MYHFRDPATNSAGTTNGADATFTTLPSAPTATAATSPTTTSFVANWTAGTGGADSYKLDVATDAGFSSMVAGYNDLAVAGTSQSVTGLTAGQTYYYRVRAVGVGGTSDNSNTIIVSSNSNSSDIIIDTEIIPLTISSLVDTQPEEQGMFFVKVRDGGASQNDGDAVGTIVNSLRVVKGSSNTVPDWSAVINEARLFKGATLLGVANLHADSLTWTGTPLFTVTDNHRDSITVKLHLKSTLPAGSDGKKFEFKINQNANVTVDGAGSQMASGGTDVVGSPGTTIDVTATKLQFVTQPPASVNSGATFSSSVKAADANNNTDEGYATNVTMAKATGTGTLAGTLTKAPVSGVASFTDLSITGTGLHSLIASSGSLTSATSNTIGIEMPGSTFKIKAGSNTPKTVAVDTLDWRNKSIWTVTSGFDTDSIPDDDIVILDNSLRAGSYVLRVGTVGPDSSRTIQIGPATSGNTIKLLIPKSSTVTNAFKFGTNGPGNYDMVIDSGGIMDNSSGRTSGTVLNIRGFSSVGDSVLIKPGGKYLHRAKVSASGILIGMSKDINTVGGTVEFDLYGPTTTARFPTHAGTVFPTLIFSATDSVITYSPSTSQASAFGSLFIKGDLIVNANATYLPGTAGGYEGDFFLRGNIVNNGTINFSSNTLNVLAMVGTSAQTISGNTFTLGKGMFVGNSAGVTLNTNVTVSGGTVQTTGTINYLQPQFPTNIFPISAAGVLNTGSSTIFLNPNGSMSEGTNPVQGNVSATRTASSGANQTFGNIGYEINALGSAPGSTTVNRKTGTGSISSGNGNQSIARYFDVTATTNTGVNATVVFSYQTSELNGNTEADLLLHRSADAGVTWSGQAGTVNTATDKITATGVNSLSRWTAASSTAPLFITHTIAIRKLQDADGNFATTGDRTAKKWRLSLYKDSVASSTLQNTGNPTNGVLTSIVAGGTYIAVEDDSLGWLHIGRVRHGTHGTASVAGTARFDTFTVVDSNPGSIDTVDFVNEKITAFVIRKLKDSDGDASTTGDQTPKRWHLALYKTSIDPSNLVSEADTSELVVGGLAPGVYIACEADSGSSWARINGNQTRYDTLTLVGTETLIDSFVNFRANSITVQKFEDADGNFNTSGDRTAKSWYLEVRQNSVSGPVVASGTGNTLTATGLGDGTYFVIEADSTDWIHLGYVQDGTPNASAANNVSVAISNGQNATVDFVNAPPAYSQMYRSFTPENIANDVDNKGKVGKYVKRKADKVQFKFNLVVGNGPNLTLKFSQEVTGAITRGKLKLDTIATFVGKKPAPMDLPVLTGDTIQIDGWGPKGKAIKADYAWTGDKLADVTSFKLNQPRLPMPNRINALYETFVQQGFSADQGLLVGVPRLDAPKSYGWVLHPKYGDVLKTLKDKTGLHTGTARGFDVFSTGKPLIKKQKSLPPKKQNNHLMASMTALKLNIAASTLDKIPNGFGELIFDDGGLTSLNGLMIKEIAARGDSIMTYFTGITSQEHGTLDSIISYINGTFEGPLDTIEFATKLVFKGTKKLIEVSNLRPNPSVIPTRIVADRPPDYSIPEVYELFQNYPNPFNPSTMIQFDIPEPAIVTLKIYNMLGQEVATLIDVETMDEGIQQVEFDASEMASGVYFYRLVANGIGDEEEGIVGQSFVYTKKMLLVK